MSIMRIIASSTSLSSSWTPSTLTVHWELMTCAKWLYELYLRVTYVKSFTNYFVSSRGESFFYPLHKVLLYLSGFLYFQLVVNWSHFYFWSHFCQIIFFVVVLNIFYFFSVICLSKFDSISSCFHYIWVFLFILRYWGVLWTLGWCSSLPNVWSSTGARRAPRSVTRGWLYDRVRSRVSIIIYLG